MYCGAGYDKAYVDNDLGNEKDYVDNSCEKVGRW